MSAVSILRVTIGGIELTILVSSQYQCHGVFDSYSCPYPSHGAGHCVGHHVWVRVCTTIRSRPCVQLHLYVSPRIYIKVGSMHSAYSAIKSYSYIYKMTMSSCLGQRYGSEQGRQGIRSIRPRRETNINAHGGVAYMRYSASQNP